MRTRPPVPKPPLTGNLFDYTRDHLGFLVRCARECYDVVRLRFINIQTYLLNHQDHIEYVLVRNDRNFWSSRSPRGSTGEPRAFGRETVGDCEIGDYHVPAGTQLIMSQCGLPTATHATTRERRVTTGAVDRRLDRDASPYAYFPFGVGPRLCIGRSFARTEAMLLLTTMARKFRLRLAQDRPVEPQPSLTLRPKTVIRVMLARH